VRSGVRLVAAVAIGSVLAMAPAYSTTIPLPLGIAAGRQTESYSCVAIGSDEDACLLRRIFHAVKAAGRLTVGGKGMEVVMSASKMRYDSTTYYCPSISCPFTTTPVLMKPFTLMGTTAGGKSFEAVCRTGSISGALPELGDAGLGFLDLIQVNASCEGGTSSVHGPFVFRFAILTRSAFLDRPENGGPTLAARFVAVMVETR
jgi:hypothetical protein